MIMLIEIKKDYFENELKEQLPKDSRVLEIAKESLTYGSSSFNVDVSTFALEELKKLYEIGNQSLKVRLSSIIKVMENTEKTKVTSLNALSIGIIELMKKDYIDGWLYHIDEDNIPHPYLVRNVKQVTPSYRNVDEKPYVEVTLVANSAKGFNKNGLYEKKITFNSDDMQKRTVAEILATRRFFKETNELKEVYLEHVALFESYQPQFNKQFWMHGPMYSEFGGYRNEKVDMQKAKGVNDEETINRKFTKHADAEYWREKGIEEKFDEIPFHSFIKMFHLDLHRQLWVHASNMTPYVYNTGLRDKLVLPQSHRDLIDILVEDMDILQEDIIEGKSGGTTILCEGKPGLGKTLSAEVYSEVIQRPLYKVHSGQLGLKSDDVQKNLEDILKRASRWGAVLLMDESDVYIRRRGNDLEHNAVIATFLRTLEYFDGLLFMTTNRGEDVDDAILSRCIAVIKFETPTQQNAISIWRVLADQLQVAISDNMITELVQKFPNVSGRDIKELLKLTSRYARGKNVSLSMEVFRQCAQFRGITMTD